LEEEAKAKQAKRQRKKGRRRIDLDLDFSRPRPTKKKTSQLLTQKRPRRRHHRQLRQRVLQVHNALVAPPGEVLAGLGHELRDVERQSRRLERVGEEAELLRARLVVDVEDHPGPKSGDVELVDLLLGHLVVVGLEEVRRRVRPQQESDPLVQHRHGEDFSFCFVPLVHQEHRAL